MQRKDLEKGGSEPGGDCLVVPVEKVEQGPSLSRTHSLTVHSPPPKPLTPQLEGGLCVGRAAQWEEDTLSGKSWSQGFRGESPLHLQSVSEAVIPP